MSVMVDVAMFVIPEPAPGTRPVIMSTASPSVPLMKSGGDGGVNHLCGACSFVLAENMDPAEELLEQLKLVLKCPRCAACNESRG